MTTVNPGYTAAQTAYRREDANYLAEDEQERKQQLERIKTRYNLVKQFMEDWTTMPSCLVLTDSEKKYFHLLIWSFIIIRTVERHQLISFFKYCLLVLD